jgi:hypothetical protein
MEGATWGSVNHYRDWEIEMNILFGVAIGWVSALGFIALIIYLVKMADEPSNVPVDAWRHDSEF